MGFIILTYCMCNEDFNDCLCDEHICHAHHDIIITPSDREASDKAKHSWKNGLSL